MIILLLGQEPGNPEELTNEHDSAGGDSPTITTASPDNAESSSEEGPRMDTEDMSVNGNNFLIGKGYIHVDFNDFTSLFIPKFFK